MRNCPPRCEQPTQIHLLPPRPDATLCSNSINSARPATEKIGPLALPYGLLLKMAAIGLSWFIARRVARTAGIDAEPVLTRMLLVGLVAARLAFVWQWRGPYFDAPVSILDIRDGGWDAAMGLAAAGLYGSLASPPWSTSGPPGVRLAGAKCRCSSRRRAQIPT